MKYVSIVDAKEQLSDLIQLLQDPKEEVYLTFNGKPIIKMPPVEEKKPIRRAGIAKDAHNRHAYFNLVCKI